MAYRLERSIINYMEDFHLSAVVLHSHLLSAEMGGAERSRMNEEKHVQ